MMRQSLSPSPPSPNKTDEIAYKSAFTKLMEENLKMKETVKKRFFVGQDIKLFNARILKAIRFIQARIGNRLFDLYYQIETRKIRTPAIPQMGGPPKVKVYEVTHSTTIKKAFGCLPIAVEESVLLDLGCGKGKVLMLALKQGVRKVIGVELSRELGQLCANNLRSFCQKLKRQKVDYEIIIDDAINHKIDEDVNVIFMFNPFDQFVMKKVIRNIKQSDYKRFTARFRSLPDKGAV